MSDLDFATPKRLFKDEKTFTTWFWKQIKTRFWHWHKLSDMDIRMKPYDAIFVYKWISAFLEIKVWSEKSKTDIIKKLRPNQKQGLTKVYNNWWLALILYYSKLYWTYQIIKYKGEDSIILNTKLAKNLLIDEKIKEKYEDLVKELEKYKYRPNPPKVDKKTLTKYEIFLEMLSGRV